MMSLNKMLKDIFILEFIWLSLLREIEYIKHGNTNIKRKQEIEINKRRNRNVITIYTVTSLNKRA